MELSDAAGTETCVACAERTGSERLNREGCGYLEEIAMDLMVSIPIVTV